MPRDERVEKLLAKYGPDWVAYGVLIDEFEAAGLTVIDATDEATIERVAQVIAGGIWRGEASPTGQARAVLAALASQ